MTMEKLGVEELACLLQNHMPVEIVNMLKAQHVTGEDFESLTVEDLKTFQFPLGYIKTINRVKLSLLENPSAVSASQVNQSNPEGAKELCDPTKYIPLLEYFSQEDLDSYSDYEKDAFLTRLERHNIMIASGGPSMSNPFKGVNKPISEPTNTPKRRKLTKSVGDKLPSRSSARTQPLSNSSETRTQTRSNTLTL